MRLVSEHSLYDDLELYSHVGNCVRVQGSGRTRDKESEFKRHNHWEPGREEEVSLPPRGMRYRSSGGDPVR